MSVIVERKGMKPGKVRYPFSYYGGKVRLFPWIYSNLPPAHAFVDVFGGSGVIALNVIDSYKRVVYNDLDWKVVNFFRVLRDQPEELVGRLSLTPCSRAEHTASWEESSDVVEQARRTFVKITQSFGKIGLRDQKSGWLLPNKNGDRVSSILSRIQGLPDIADKLMSIEIENMESMDLIKKECREDTLLFADPPYVHGTRQSPTAYYHEMKDSDHVEMCESLNKVDANVVLCGYDNNIYNDILVGWKTVKKQTSSKTSEGKKTKNANRVECLWIKR